MVFFKKFRFLTYSTLGLFYDIYGGILLSLVYNPIIQYKGMRVGDLYGALVNPNQSSLLEGVRYMMLGFTFSLIDHQLNIYKPRRKKVVIFWKIILILASLFIAYRLWPLLIVLLIALIKFPLITIASLLLLVLITFFLLYKPKNNQ